MSSHSEFPSIGHKHSSSHFSELIKFYYSENFAASFTRVGTLIVATIFYNWYKIDTCFEVLLSFNIVTSIVYNPLPAMWKS